MNRNEKGQFVKGYKSLHIGKSKWGFGNCVCGKKFKIYKREHGLQKFCSQSCAMLRNKRAKGHVISKETREKISKTWIKKDSIPWNKDKKTGFAPWKGKKRPNLSGSKHPQWKGGVTSLHEKIRKSFEYKLWRKAIFERDSFTCIWCGKRGGYLEADHIKPFAFFPELRLAIDNGRTLCRECHRKTKTYGYYIGK